ncbi:hypothetical protein [Nitrosovibrio sp. Nv6]|uniref:hypothetical protein n=1 Tax=Nitrosovibrio sp. Nv6 TaxID=1855340 RepID=UPI000B21DAF8|nr:hypothetical protein [Nitrosovibrio sp. Nv6]
MKNNFFHVGLLTLAGSLLAGCVTINIYFPAAAAEKAADKIIEEVWQLKKPGESGGMDKSAPSEPSSQPAIQPQQPQQ